MKNNRDYVIGYLKGYIDAHDRFVCDINYVTELEAVDFTPSRHTSLQEFIKHAYPKSTPLEKNLHKIQWEDFKQILNENLVNHPHKTAPGESLPALYLLRSGVSGLIHFFETNFNLEETEIYSYEPTQEEDEELGYCVDWNMFFLLIDEKADFGVIFRGWAGD